MAYIGDSCLRIGDINWYIGDEESFIPNASIYPEVAQVAVNSYLRLDASSSYTDDELDTIDYVWELTASPHDSAVGITTSIVVSNEGTTAQVLFDKVGAYRIKLTVKGASGGCSQPAYCDVVAVPFIASHSDQVSFDTSWIWQLLPSFWGRLENVDRKRIETFWRGTHQVIASDILEAYNVEQNQSIATIQKNIIKKWKALELKYEPNDALLFIAPNKEFPIVDESVVVESGFVKSFRLTNYENTRTYEESRGNSYNVSSTLISDTEFITNEFIPNFSVGSDVVITAYRQNLAVITFNNKIVSVDTLGSSNLITLSNRLPLEQNDLPLPTSISVEVMPPRYADAFIVYTEKSNYACKFLQRSNKFELVNKLPNQGNAQKVKTLSLIKSQDLEKQGVSAGDIGYITISDINRSYTADVKINILGVDDDFVLFDLSRSLYEELDSITQIFESEIYSTELVNEIYQAITSESFIRKYCYQPITKGNTVVVTVGGGSREYSISLKKIIRTKRVPIDSDIVSIPKITEFIEKTHFDGTNLLTDFSSKQQRKPFDLIQNLHYYIEPEQIKGGGIRRSALSNNVLICSTFNFAQANIQAGDTLYIKSGEAEGYYTIIGVSAISIQIDKDVPHFRKADFVITRLSKRQNKFVIFHNSLQLKDTIIDRLWAESSIVDNRDTIELNFGSLLKFKYDDWFSRGLSTSYYSAVLGLLLARMSSPSIRNIELATSIIAGVPFTDKRSRVIDIVEDYEVDTVTGTPIESMMLLEELDENDEPTGLFRSFKLPSINNIRDFSTTGIGINNLTGDRYKVDDIVEQYAVLGLGVYVADLYKDVSINQLKDVADRHKFKVKINVDSVDSTSNAYKFISDFIFEIKPSYTQFIVTLLKFLTDEIKIDDDVFFNLKKMIFDNPYLQRNTAQVFNFIKSRYQFNDEPSFIELNHKYDSNASVTPINNSFSTLHSLDTNFNNVHSMYKIRTSSSENPDLLVFRTNIGAYNRFYPIHSILDNHTIKINAKIDIPSASFSILRPIRNKMFSGIVELDATKEGFPLSDIDCEIVQGDYVMLIDEGYAPRQITGINAGYVQTNPPMNFGGTKNTRIQRVSLDTKVQYEGEVVAVGSYCELDLLNAYTAGIQPGDILVGGDHSSRIVCVSTNNKVWAWPRVPSGSYRIVRELESNSDEEFQDAVDEFQKAYMDTSFLCLRKKDGESFVETFENGQFTHEFELYPGDIIQVYGSNEDVGEGIGVYRVIDKNHNDKYRVCFDDLNGLLSYIVIRQAPLRRLYIDQNGLTNTVPNFFGIGD
jgi:hypothetical protein